MCVCVCVCVNAEHVSSNRCRNVYRQFLSFSLALIQVGDIVTSTSEARQECEWAESNKVSHIMSIEYPPWSRQDTHFFNNEAASFLAVA